MAEKSSNYLDRIRRLNVYRSGDRRAPHKPLLLLLANRSYQDGDGKDCREMY